MDFNIEKEEIIKYLEKNYTVFEYEFITRFDKNTEWGDDIISSLCVIFSIEKEYSDKIFNYWALDKGLDDEQYKKALRPRTLKASFNLEMANDLAQYGLNVEESLITILSSELAKEIDMSIINELRQLNKITNTDEMLSVVKCLGFEEGESVYYDPITHTPKKKFYSIKRKEIENERQNNPIWQYWFRTRRPYS
jgi:hypothetical protein